MISDPDETVSESDYSDGVESLDLTTETETDDEPTPKVCLKKKTHLFVKIHFIINLFIFLIYQFRNHDVCPQNLLVN